MPFNRTRLAPVEAEDRMSVAGTSVIGAASAFVTVFYVGLVIAALVFFAAAIAFPIAATATVVSVPLTGASIVVSASYPTTYAVITRAIDIYNFIFVPVMRFYTGTLLRFPIIAWNIGVAVVEELVTAILIELIGQARYAKILAEAAEDINDPLKKLAPTIVSPAVIVRIADLDEFARIRDTIDTMGRLIGCALSAVLGICISLVLIAVDFVVALVMTLVCVVPVVLRAIVNFVPLFINELADVVEDVEDVLLAIGSFFLTPLLRLAEITLAFVEGGLGTLAPVLDAIDKITAAVDAAFEFLVETILAGIIAVVNAVISGIRKLGIKSVHKIDPHKIDKITSIAGKINKLKTASIEFVRTLPPHIRAIVADKDVRGILESLRLSALVRDALAVWIRLMDTIDIGADGDASIETCAPELEALVNTIPVLDIRVPRPSVLSGIISSSTLIDVSIDMSALLARAFGVVVGEEGVVGARRAPGSGAHASPTSLTARMSAVTRRIGSTRDRNFIRHIFASSRLSPASFISATAPANCSASDSAWCRHVESRFISASVPYDDARYNYTYTRLHGYTPQPPALADILPPPPATTANAALARGIRGTPLAAPQQTRRGCTRAASATGTEGRDIDLEDCGAPPISIHEAIAFDPDAWTPDALVPSFAWFPQLQAVLASLHVFSYPAPYMDPDFEFFAAPALSSDFPDTCTRFGYVQVGTHFDPLTGKSRTVNPVDAMLQNTRLSILDLMDSTEMYHCPPPGPDVVQFNATTGNSTLVPGNCSYGPTGSRSSRFLNKILYEAEVKAGRSSWLGYTAARARALIFAPRPSLAWGITNAELRSEISASRSRVCALIHAPQAMTTMSALVGGAAVVVPLIFIATFLITALLVAMVVLAARATAAALSGLDGRIATAVVVSSVVIAVIVGRVAFADDVYWFFIIAAILAAYGGVMLAVAVVGAIAEIATREYRRYRGRHADAVIEIPGINDADPASYPTESPEHITLTVAQAMLRMHGMQEGSAARAAAAKRTNAALDADKLLVDRSASAAYAKHAADDAWGEDSAF